MPVGKKGEKKPKTASVRNIQKITEFLQDTRRTERLRIRQEKRERTTGKISAIGEPTMSGSDKIPTGEEQLEEGAKAVSNLLKEETNDPVLLALQQLDKKFGDMNVKLDKMNNWKTDIEARVSSAEDTVKTKVALIDKFQDTITFMDETAKETSALTGGTDKTFQNIDLMFQEERVSTVKSVMALEQRLNSLEREVRSYNVRIKGIAVTGATNIKTKVISVLNKAVPDLKAHHIEYVYKIPVKDIEVSEPVHALAPAPTPPEPLLLVRFTDRQMRNKVFFKCKKFKFEPKVTIKDDMIKPDYINWAKAKPQMQEAHSRGKPLKYRYSKLIVDSKSVRIDGVETEAEILLQARESSTLEVVKSKKRK